jgi:KaiC/GvpD/RAD55 family RecA-like ATPase
VTGLARYTLKAAGGALVYMDYALAVEGAPASVPGGTGILLLHPSTGETDRIDTDFLKDDTDAYLVISTRTTAREVKQKLEHFDVDQDAAVILDTLSVERGYSRRRSDNIHYVSAPDDLDGIVAQTRRFFESTSGKRRVSVDSITEMAYYADESSAREATERLLELIREHDAVGLFHLSPEVHEGDVVAAYEALFDGVIELAEDGRVSTRF